MIKNVGYSQHQIDKLIQDRGFEILGEIMISTVDDDWNKLVDFLGRIRKPSYQPNQKYIVHHQDTEYFIGNVAFAIENFNRVIKALDIDPCRFVIYTNHYGSTAKWLEYCHYENNQFIVIESPWTNHMRYEQPMEIAPSDDLNYHFSCIMGIAKKHRDKIAHWILQNHLEKSNLVVYNRIPIIPKPEEMLSHPEPLVEIDHFSYLSPVPFTRINEQWTNQSRLDSSLVPLKNQNILPYQSKDKFFSPWYQSIFFELVGETVFNYPYAFISEKTANPIIHGRPFVLVAAPRTLEWLHNMGFKTFNRWWDESYDQCLDPNSRLEKIFATTAGICSNSLEQCQQMLKEMTPVLMHNQKIYKELAF